MNDLEPGQLTKRWYTLRYHKGQHDYAHCTTRFVVVPAGRRAGKTEIAKRRIVLRALAAHLPGQFHCEHDDPRFGVGAPTVAQVRAIYWDDLKALIPVRFLYGKPNESRMEIKLINGARINLYGMDKPERVEGTPFDGFVLDEFGNMKEDAWPAHLQPSLSDRGGWCDLIGVPEGRNHYYDLYKEAQAHKIEADAAGIEPEWETFHWTSEDILPLYRGVLGTKEIERARKEYDPITYSQEYLAAFENYTGRAYYQFTDDNQAALEYDPTEKLIFCFDFNVEPSVAVVCQEGRLPLPGEPLGTKVLGEVHIQRGGNVLLVCDRLIRDWGHHLGKIWLYGDATGGSRGAAKILGSEWELAKRKLRDKYGASRLVWRVPKRNPRERDRINAVNSRFKGLTGEMHCMVDPRKCKNLVKDLEGVCLVKGGTGEINKMNPKLTHLSDALGYYLSAAFPITRVYKRSTRKHW